ncbi:MAG: hypothetical protein K6G03_12700 [Lachnospiraceae bacterium]|nr:hypothetical protein [Lachnospiraceae bacterium]
MKERELGILKSIYDTFINGKEPDTGIEVQFLDKDESGLETDMVTTLHHSFGTVSNIAEGEFYFEDDVFVSRILIATEIDTANIPKLCVLISVINSELPAGCFEYDPAEDLLAYSLKTPVTDSMTEDEVSYLTDRNVAIALSVSEQYSHDLILCARDTEGITQGDQYGV